jgi:transposase
MRNDTQKKNYTGKTVYVGMDVHKKTYAITTICEGIVINKVQMKADPKELIKYLEKNFPGANIESAYEAGFCGLYLHRCLIAAGIQNRVVDAASIELAASDRVKTDKRDSLKIATHLSQGRLKAIHTPTVDREDKRNITRTRSTLVQERTRVGNRLKSQLYLHGMIPHDDKRKISEKWIKEIRTLDVLPGLKYALEEFASIWLDMNERIKKIDKEVLKQAQEDCAIDRVYRATPGIGPTSARILANELGDTLQFSNERRLSSYLGLTPTEHSSGENIRQGHITRRGKPLLRMILIQVAWMAIRRDTQLMAVYKRLKLRIGGKKAIVAVARRIMGKIRACFRTNTLYSLDHQLTTEHEELTEEQMSEWQELQLA